jgi:hypothetical protein
MLYWSGATSQWVPTDSGKLRYAPEDNLQGRLYFGTAGNPATTGYSIWLDASVGNQFYSAAFVRSAFGNFADNRSDIYGVSGKDGLQIGPNAGDTVIRITGTTIKFNKLTSNGFVKTQNSDGSLYVDTSSFAGTSGTSGTSGANGTSGTSGANGATGTSGTSGTSGAGGTHGTSSTGGTSGANGATGTSGTSGLNSTAGTSGAGGTHGTSSTSGTSATGSSLCIGVTCNTDGFSITGGTVTPRILTISGGNVNITGSTADSLTLFGDVVLYGSSSGNKVGVGGGTLPATFNVTGTTSDSLVRFIDVSGATWLDIDVANSNSTMWINKDQKKYFFNVSGSVGVNLFYVNGKTDIVGIGTSSAVAKLYIYANITSDVGNPALYLSKTLVGNGADPFIQFSGVTSTGFTGTNPNFNISTFAGTDTSTAQTGLTGPRKSAAAGKGGWIFNRMIRVKDSDSPAGDLWFPAYRVDP